MTDCATPARFALKEHAGRETAFFNWFREPRHSYCRWTMCQQSAATTEAAQTLDHEDGVHVRDPPLVQHERSDRRHQWDMGLLALTEAY